VGEPRSLEDGRTPGFVLPGEASCDLPFADGEVCEVRAGDGDGPLTQRRDDGLAAAQRCSEIAGGQLVQGGVVARPALDVLGEPVQLPAPLRIIIGHLFRMNDQQVDVAGGAAVAARSLTKRTAYRKVDGTAN